MHGQPAGVEHLTPAGPERQLAGHNRQEVAVQVRPSVRSLFVAQTSIKLDHRAQVDVVDVAECRALALMDSALTLSGRQSVWSLDPQQVMTLEDRVGAGVDIAEDLEQQPSVLEPRTLFQRSRQSPSRGPALLDGVGQQGNGRVLARLGRRR